MALIPVNPAWSNVDISHIADNWVVDIDGTARRMSSRVRPIQALAEATTHLVGQSPRITFGMARPTDGLADSMNTAEPLHVWQYNDNDRQGRDRVVRILAVPMAANVSNTNTVAAVYLGTQNQQSYSYNLNVGTNYHWDLYYTEIDVPRGDEANAVINTGISTYGAMRIMDLVVQDKEIYDLQSDVHESVTMDTARPMDVITPQLVDDTRKALHNQRTKGQPVESCWSADTVSGTWNPAASPGDRRGITVDPAAVGADTYVNLLDQSFTARAANSPGFSSHVYRAGYGNDATANGQSVKCVWRFHAGLDDTDISNARIKVQGPADSAEVNVVAGIGAPDWYTATTVHANAAIADDDESISRNKFDLFAQAHNGAVHILGWTMEREAS